MSTLRKLGMAILIALVFAGCGSKKTTTQATPTQNNQQTVSVPTQQEEDPEIIALQKEIKKKKLEQELAGMTTIDPCGDYYDDESYYRDFGIATSVNQASAQSLSIAAAKDNIKQHMAEFVQGMTSSYFNLYAGSKPSDDIQRKMERKMIGTVEEMLNSAEKICQQNGGKNDKGAYVYYAAFQVSKKNFKKELTSDLNQLSKEEKLEIDFKDQQFQKFMDERMQQQLEAKKNAGY